MKEVLTKSPYQLNPNTSTLDSWWNHLSPGLKAAIVVGVVIVLLEVLSDVLPVIGFVVTIPIAIITYYIQGILVGRFLKHDLRFPDPQAGIYLRSGLISALWTSVVISTAVALIDAVFLTSLTFGAFLATVPLLLVSSLADLVFNVIFTTLGAWSYSRFASWGLVEISCAILILALSSFCLAVGIFVFGGIDLLRHLNLAMPMAFI
jgi:hypothetical protein